MHIAMYVYRCALPYNKQTMQYNYTDNNGDRSCYTPCIDTSGAIAPVHELAAGVL